MASFSAKNPHSSKAPLSSAETRDLSVGQLAKKRWDHAFGCPISHAAKKQFTLAVGEKHYVLADVRLVRGRIEEDPASLPLEFFFDGTIDGLDLEAFNKAFEQKVEEQLQERRIHVFRKKLAENKARRRGHDEEGGGFGGADPDDDNWKAYLGQKVDPTQFQIAPGTLREAGCMICFVAIQATLSCSACQTLGEVAFPEHFLVAAEAEEAMAEENKMPMPRWVYAMGALVAVTFLSSAYAIFEVGKNSHVLG